MVYLLRSSRAVIIFLNRNQHLLLPLLKSQENLFMLSDRKLRIVPSVRLVLLLSQEDIVKLMSSARLMAKSPLQRLNADKNLILVTNRNTRLLSGYVPQKVLNRQRSKVPKMFYFILCWMVVWISLDKSYLVLDVSLKTCYVSWKQFTPQYLWFFSILKSSTHSDLSLYI